MGLSHFSVGPADPVEGANKNYESEGRTFESFRARHFLLVVFSALRAARLADPWFRRRAVSRL